ncbi:MAG: hypothetical protein ACRDLS_01230 [Solirubrobacteraceae bacterium]
MGDRARAALPYFALAVLCGAIGIHLALSQSGERKLERAGEELRSGRYAEALAELEGVDGQGSGRAAALRGYAHIGRGQYERAAPEFSAAVRRAPNDWVLQRDYAIVLRTIGQRATARARMQLALSLNPRMALPRGFRAVERVRSSRRRR